jgi:hypothetical protein
MGFQAMSGAVVSRLFFTFTDRHDKHRHHVVSDLVNQPIARGTKLYLVAVRQAMQPGFFYSRLNQHFCELLFKLRLNRHAQFFPLFQRARIKRQLIDHPA